MSRLLPLRIQGETGSGCNWLTKFLPPSNRVPSPSEARDPRRQAPRPTHGPCRHPALVAAVITTEDTERAHTSSSRPLLQAFSLPWSALPVFAPSRDTFGGRRKTLETAVAAPHSPFPAPTRPWLNPNAAVWSGHGHGRTSKPPSPRRRPRDRLAGWPGWEAGEAASPALSPRCVNGRILTADETLI